MLCPAALPPALLPLTDEVRGSHRDSPPQSIVVESNYFWTARCASVFETTFCIHATAAGVRASHWAARLGGGSAGEGYGAWPFWTGVAPEAEWRYALTSQPSAYQIAAAMQRILRRHAWHALRPDARAEVVRRAPHALDTASGGAEFIAAATTADADRRCPPLAANDAPLIAAPPATADALATGGGSPAASDAPAGDAPAAAAPPCEVLIYFAVRPRIPSVAQNVSVDLGWLLTAVRGAGVSYVWYDAATAAELATGHIPPSAASGWFGFDPSAVRCVPRVSDPGPLASDAALLPGCLLSCHSPRGPGIDSPPQAECRERPHTRRRARDPSRLRPIALALAAAAAHAAAVSAAAATASAVAASAAPGTVHRPAVCARLRQRRLDRARTRRGRVASRARAPAVAARAIAPAAAQAPAQRRGCG